MGLPFRFNVAAEAQFERFNGGGGARSVSLEARWALLIGTRSRSIQQSSLSNKFGVAPIRHEEVPPPREQEERGGGRRRRSHPRFQMPMKFDYSLRRILGPCGVGYELVFRKRKYWDRGREWGFSQAIMTPVLLPNERLKNRLWK
jgi:hypothetical protein